MSQQFNITILRLKEVQGTESVSAFARRLEIPHRTLDSYLKGERKLSLDLALRVCAKCHVSADWLLGLTDQRAPFAEVPRQNNVSKIREMQEKFSSFGRTICSSVRQRDKILNPQEITEILCNLTDKITRIETQISALQSTSIATCG